MPTDHIREWIAVQPRRHDADGHAYIAYYRKDQNLGFMWDGDIEHPIQVTHEMGEAVHATFDIDLPAGLSMPQLLLRFRNACDGYIRIHEGDLA